MRMTIRRSSPYAAGAEGAKPALAGQSLRQKDGCSSMVYTVYRLRLSLFENLIVIRFFSYFIFQRGNIHGFLK